LKRRSDIPVPFQGTALSLWFYVYNKHTHISVHMYTQSEVLGFKLSASYLLGRCSTTWGITPDLYALVIFQTRSYNFLIQASLRPHPPTYASHISWDYMCAPPYTAYLLRCEHR
jgi:hypothetical protein